MVDTIRPFKAGGLCQNYDLVAEDVRLVKFEVLSIFASMYTGLAEVRFSGQSTTVVRNEPVQQSVPRGFVGSRASMILDLRGRAVGQAEYCRGEFRAPGIRVQKGKVLSPEIK